MTSFFDEDAWSDSSEPPDHNYEHVEYKSTPLAPVRISGKTTPLVERRNTIVTKTLREGGTGAILFNIEESEGDEIFDKAADAWKRHGKWKTRNTEKTWYGHVEWYCNQKHGQETTWWINGGNLRSTKQWNFGNPIETENWYTTKGDLYEVHDWRQKCVHKRPTVTVCDTGETERDCWKCKRQSAGSYKHSSSPYHR